MSIRAVTAEARQQTNRISPTESAIWAAISHADKLGHHGIADALFEILELRAQRAARTRDAWVQPATRMC